MAEREDVLVIGGGAVGVCCALELARSGRRVRLIELGELCAGCSAGNAGLVPTSSCAPLAEPGVMGQSLRWMLDPIVLLHCFFLFFNHSFILCGI